MISFGADYVDRLNAQYDAGKFLKAVIVTEDAIAIPQIKKYWVDHEVPIDFDGNTYQPLHMFWDSIKTSQSMPIDGPTISVSNIGNAAGKYLREIDITGNDCIIQILHLDLLSQTTGYWKRKLKVMGFNADNMVATFTLGRQLGKNRLPRGTILKNEFPGINSDVPRIFGV